MNYTWRMEMTSPPTARPDGRRAGLAPHPVGAGLAQGDNVTKCWCSVFGIRYSVFGIRYSSQRPQ
jgi:hypothetical protein